MTVRLNYFVLPFEGSFMYYYYYYYLLGLVRNRLGWGRHGQVKILFSTSSSSPAVNKYDCYKLFDDGVATEILLDSKYYGSAARQPTIYYYNYNIISYELLKRCAIRQIFFFFFFLSVPSNHELLSRTPGRYNNDNSNGHCLLVSTGYRNRPLMVITNTRNGTNSPVSVRFSPLTAFRFSVIVVRNRNYTIILKSRLTLMIYSLSTDVI